MPIRETLGVKALVPRPCVGGEYLFLQRSHNVSRPGGWDLPGGRVEPGETPRRAIGRELPEEIGVDIGRKTMRLFFTSTHIEATGNPGEQVSATRLYYEAPRLRIPCIQLSEEHSDFKWMTLEEAKECFGGGRHSDAIEHRMRLESAKFDPQMLQA